MLQLDEKLLDTNCFIDALKKEITGAIKRAEKDHETKSSAVLVAPDSSVQKKRKGSPNAEPLRSKRRRLE